MQVDGKFSGAFFSINEPGMEGKVHEECMDRFKQKTAPKCLFCKMPVCKIEGKFSGAFYTIEERVVLRYMRNAFEIPVVESAKMLQMQNAYCSRRLIQWELLRIEKRAKYIKSVIRHSRH